MTKIKESHDDLQIAKEDIQNLLSSLDGALSEGSITQEHYNEVKQKNAEKLEEISKKLKILERQEGKEANLEEGAPAEPEPAPEAEPEKHKAEKPAKQEKKKASKEEPQALPAEPAKDVAPASAPAKESPAEEKKPSAGGGEKSIDVAELEERIKEKTIMELAPKMDKINVRMVKLKAFVDALKDDKTSERENTQRITEEVGESRSTLTTMEGRLSEIEMKLEDATETLGELKPQKFTKELQKKEEELKLHDARLEKLDDISATILKRVNQIQIILEKLGNIESIAEMTKDISKKMVSMDEKEKKISRLADKIDNMFVELNKRLEEFMFYKAKQDSMDDLTKEMLKSIDELSTKLMRYAEKDDLELLRDSLESKMNTMMKEGVAAAAPAQAQAVQAMQNRTEIESLMKLLDEQFKKGQMSKKDYEKAKEANMKKLKEMSKDQVVDAPAPALQEAQPGTEATEPAAADAGLSQAAEMTDSVETLPPTEEPEQAMEIQPEPAAETEPEPEPESEPAPEPVVHVKEKTKPKPEPEPAPEAEKPKSKPSKKAESEPEPEKPKKKEPEKQEIRVEIKPAAGKKQRMLADLEYSLRKGLISQQAYEKTQKIIMSQKF